MKRSIEKEFEMYNNGWSTTIRVLVAGLVGLGLASVASADKSPHFITYKFPGSVATGCFSDCSVIVNKRGEVIGSYFTSDKVYHGFIRSPDGKLTTVDDPDADMTAGDYNGTFPNAINDAGAITGFYVDVNNVEHGFLRSPDGVFTTFDIPGYSSTVPINLNLAGTVIGYANNSEGVFRAFARSPDGKFRTWIGSGACDTSPATGCYGSAAFGINVSGVIAGGYENKAGNFVGHGFVRNEHGRIVSYSVAAGGTGPYEGTGCPGCSVALNQFGVIAGLYIDANFATHGYIRDASGDINTFDAPGEGAYGFGCAADCSIGMNDKGAIASSYLDSNNVYHGFVRFPNGKTVPFDAPGADTTPNKYHGTFPVSINEEGVIAGSYTDSNGIPHAFLYWP